MTHVFARTLMALSEEILKRKDELLNDVNEVELPFALTSDTRLSDCDLRIIYWQNLLDGCNRRKHRSEVRLNSKALINWLSQNVRRIIRRCRRRYRLAGNGLFVFP